MALNPALEQGELRELKEACWNAELDRALHEARMSLADLEAAGWRDRRKIQLACRLREAGAPYVWIAGKLGLMSADALRVRVYRYRKLEEPKM